MCSGGATQGFKRLYKCSLSCRQITSIALCYESIPHAPWAKTLVLVACCISKPRRVINSCCMQNKYVDNKGEMGLRKQNKEPQPLAPPYCFPTAEKLCLSTLVSPWQQSRKSYSSHTIGRCYSLWNHDGKAHMVCVLQSTNDIIDCCYNYF